MKTDRQGLGDLGERLAADHLGKQGATIAARNVRYPVGEIDIVARQGNLTLFVEVRIRRGTRFGSPEESITPAKQRRLLLAANRYAAEHPEIGENWRIDLIAIALSPSGKLERIEQIEGMVEG